MRIKLGEKIAYAFGDFSNNAAYIFVSTFLLSFLTIGLGLKGTTAGMIVSLVTLWDAINDVLIGNLVDKLHGRGTKYAKILRLVVGPACVTMVLMFFSPNFGTTGRIIWAFLLYAIFTVCYTAYGVPYGAMAGSMTDDEGDRISLGAFRDWGANLGTLLINSTATVMIIAFSGAAGDMTARGFTLAAIVCAAILFVGGMIPGLFCKERLPIVANQETPILVGLKSYARNTPAILATIVICMVNCALIVRGSFGVYYTMYYLGDGKLMAPIMTVLSIVPLIVIFFVPALTKKLGRRVMYIIAGVSMILGGVIQLFAGNVIGSMVSSVFGGLSLCCSITVTWGAVPDLADYGEWKTGVYCPGTCYSTITFVMKAATAISSYALGSILDSYGFDASNVTEAAVNGIRLWFGVLPIILGAVALLSGFFFNLNRAKLDEVHAELAKRHSAE